MVGGGQTDLTPASRTQVIARESQPGFVGDRASGGLSHLVDRAHGERRGGHLEIGPVRSSFTRNEACQRHADPRQWAGPCEEVAQSIAVEPPAHELAVRAGMVVEVERDTELAKLAGCNILFIPSAEEMYPAGFSSSAIVENISELAQILL